MHALATLSALAIGFTNAECLTSQEGLTIALKGISVLGVPIYITETGISEKGDEFRPKMIQSYFEEVRSRALHRWILHTPALTSDIF